MKPICFLSLFWLALPCAADSGAPPSDSSSAATIHVVQAPGDYCAHRAGCGDDSHPYARAYLDGNDIGELADGYLRRQVTAGPHELTVEIYADQGRRGAKRTASTKFEATRGSQYYFRAGASGANEGPANASAATLIQITRKEGLALLGTRARRD